MSRVPRLTSCAVLALLTASLFAGLAPPAAAAAVDAWSAPASLETAPNDTVQPRVAVASDGSAMAVWQQATNTTPYIAANLYAPGSGWMGATNISIGATGATSPRIAAADNGRFLVAWVGNNNVSASWYTPSSGWSAPVQIIASGSAVASLSVAADSSGRAALAWSSNNFPNRVQAALYNPSLGWASPTLFATQFTASSATVGLGPSGGAVVAWRENTGTVARVSASVFIPGWGWTAAASIVGNYPLAAYNDMFPAAAMAANGSALVVARMQLGTPYLAVRYMPGSGWQPNTTLSPIYGGVAYNPPTLDLDGAGDAIVPVTESLANGSYASELFLFNATTGAWMNALVPGTGFTAGNTAAALDNDGRALVAWTEDTGSGFMAHAVRFLPVSGWGTTVDFSAAVNASLGASGRLAADLGANGEGALVWTSNASGPVDLYGAVFARDTLAPSLMVSSPSPGATNASRFMVAGTTDPGASVTVDGTPVAVDGAGAFSTNLTLLDGPHTFRVLAFDAEGNRAASDVAVLVDTTAPSLTLTAPMDGANFQVAAVVVSGTAEPGAVVRVNGYAIPADAGGHFSSAVAIADGPNLITVTATDAAGNSAAASRTVTFTNPLASDLTSAQANLTQAQADLAAARAQLDIANSSLAAANDAVTASNANLVTAYADLAAAEANLAVAEAGANTSQAELNASRANLALAQDNLTAARAQATASAAQLDAARAAYDGAVKANVDLSARFNETTDEMHASEAALNESRADAASAQAAASGSGAAASTALLIALVAVGFAAIAMARARRHAPTNDEPARKAGGSSSEKGRAGKDEDEDD